MADDTRSVIAESIASMRQDSPEDGGPDPTESIDAGDAVVDDPDPAGEPDDHPETDDQGEPVVEPPVVDPPVEEKKADDDFDAEPEFNVDSMGRKRVNSIPQPRVKKMVETSVRKAVEAKEAEFAVKAKEHEARVAHWNNIDSISMKNPERFMEILAGINPAYKAYVKGGQAAPVVEKPAANDEPRPGPDAQLADGTPAYSPEGFQKLEEWNARQVEKRVMGQVSERYKWLEDAKKAQDAHDALLPEIQAQMQDATANWQGFEENLDAIKDAFVANPKFTLHDAYRQVMVAKHTEALAAKDAENAKLKTDRNSLRAEILKELNGKAKSTATVPITPVGKVEVADADNPATTTKDLIRASIAAIKGRR